MTKRQSIADALRRAREDEGLTPGELADRAGVSRVTVLEAERGRDLRLDTLFALVDALGTLDPARLLGGIGRTPPASTQPWKWWPHAFGLVVRDVRRIVTIAGDGSARLRVELHGVRPAGGATRSLEELVRLAWLGGAASWREIAAELVARPDACRRTVSFEAGENEARLGLRVPRRPGKDGFLHWREDPLAPIEALPAEIDACRAAGLVQVIRLPVETVELRCRRPASWSGVMRLLAWPDAAPPPGPRESESFSRLAIHPRRATRRTRDVVEDRIRLVQPPIGACVALAWSLDDDGETQRETPASERRASVAETLRRARQSAGLSQRQLAERSGVSAMTISAAERDRRLATSTTIRLLEALPELSSWEMLGFDGSARASARRAHAWQRDFHGCEAELETKRVRLSANGDAKLSIETRRLRSLRRPPEDLRVLVGAAAPVLRPSRARLQGVGAGGALAESQVRIARLDGDQHGATGYLLSVPGSLAASGIDFTRMLSHDGVYTMTSKRAREATGEPGPFHEGASFAPTIPVQRLVLEVVAPPRWWPADVSAHAWPLAQRPDPAAFDVAPRLHPEGLLVETDRRSRLLRLVVEKPLVGVKYAIAWTLP